MQWPSRRAGPMSTMRVPGVSREKSQAETSDARPGPAGSWAPRDFDALVVERCAREPRALDLAVEVSGTKAGTSAAGGAAGYRTATGRAAADRLAGHRPFTGRSLSARSLAGRLDVARRIAGMPRRDQEGSRSRPRRAHRRFARGGHEGMKAVSRAWDLHHPREAAIGVEAPRHQVPVPVLERHPGAEGLAVEAQGEGAVRVEEESEALARLLRPGAEEGLAAGRRTASATRRLAG